MSNKEQWYKVNTLLNIGDYELVEVERSTEKSVWINGRRCEISSRYCAYVKGKTEAIEMAGNVISGHIEANKRKIQTLQEQVEKLESKLSELD